MIPPDELAECGGELIYAVDYTPGGFPIGLTLTEMRREAERDARSAGWVRAKHILRDLLEHEVGAVRDIGWVKKIGDGLSRDLFAADVELVDGRDGTYVVALPRRDADPTLDERTHRELKLIAKLRGRDFPFRLPQMVGAFPDGDRLALVRRFVSGIELELRPGRQGTMQPWEIVAEIAAAIHALPGRDFADILPARTRATVMRGRHSRCPTGSSRSRCVTRVAGRRTLAAGRTECAGSRLLDAYHEVVAPMFRPSTFTCTS